MDIAYISPAYFNDESHIGGGERYPINLARSLVSANRNARVKIYSFGRKPTVRNIAQNIDLIVCGSENASQGNALLANSTSAELFSLLADADLVHVFQPFTKSGEVAVLQSLNMNKPLVLTDLGGQTSTAGIDNGMISLCNAMVCISEFSKSRFTKYFHPLHLVVKGPYDSEKFFFDKDKYNSTLKLLYVGRLLPHKNIDGLIEALPYNLDLTICGRPYHRNYVSLLKKMARGKKVKFIFDLDDDDLLDMYQRSNVVILPSTYRDVYDQYHPYPELMGLTLLEGMACGCFAICNNVGGMPEFIPNNNCGAVFRSTEGLSKILSDLADEPQKHLSAAQSLERSITARDNFGLAVIGEQISKIYDAAIRR